MLILKDIDLDSNEALQARLENLASAPSTSIGRVYFNTTDNTVYCWNGTSWKDMLQQGGGGGLAQKAGKEVSGSFTGNPKKATVTFTTAFADADYSPLVISSIDSRNWTVESIVAGSFVINTNSSSALTADVLWTATKHGE